MSVLYKKLVAPQVVPCSTVSAQSVRIYCQCANKIANNTPAIVVFAMNMKERQAKIRLQGLTTSDDEQNRKVFAYVLHTEYSLLSRY